MRYVELHPMSSAKIRPGQRLVFFAPTPNPWRHPVRWVRHHAKRIFSRIMKKAHADGEFVVTDVVEKEGVTVVTIFDRNEDIRI